MRDWCYPFVFYMSFVLTKSRRFCKRTYTVVTQSALFSRSFFTLFVALFVNGPIRAPIIAQSAYILQVALTCFEFVLNFVKGPLQWSIRAPSALAHFSCFLHDFFRSFFLVFVNRPIQWPIILVEELTCHKLKNTPFS